MVSFLKQEFGDNILDSILDKTLPYMNGDAENDPNNIVYDPISDTPFDLDLVSYISKTLMDRIEYIYYHEKCNIKKDQSFYDAFKDDYSNFFKDDNIMNLIKQLKNDTFVKNKLKGKLHLLNKELIQKMVNVPITVFENFEGLLDVLSVMKHSDDESEDIGDIYMQGKYGKLMQYIVKQMNKNYADIHLNTQVTNINYLSNNNPYRVHIQTKFYDISKHSMIVKNYYCNYVILCVPVFCLQERQIKFKPNLKPRIWNAIDHRYIIYVKIY